MPTSKHREYSSRGSIPRPRGIAYPESKVRASELIPPVIQLGAAEADAFLCWITCLHDDWGPGSEDLIVAFNDQVKEEFTRLRARAANWSWADLSNEFLVGVLRGWRQARENALMFLSSLGGKWAYTRSAVDQMPERICTEWPVPDESGDIRTLTFPRRWMYLHLLQGLDRQRGTLLFRWDLLLHAAHSFAATEAAHRALRHIGFHAARLLLEQRWLALGRVSIRSEQGIEYSLKNLRRLISSTLKRTATPRVLPRLAEVEAPGDKSAMDSILDTQAWETIEKRLRSKSWDEILLDVLNGQLNILPRAIADDISDRAARVLPRPEVVLEPMEEVEGEVERIRVRILEAEERPTPDARVEQLHTLLATRPDLKLPGSGMGERANAKRTAKIREAAGLPARAPGRPATRSGRSSS